MKDPVSLPHKYCEKAEEEPLPRIICDYIAGMTDNYIYEQYDNFVDTSRFHALGCTILAWGRS